MVLAIDMLSTTVTLREGPGSTTIAPELFPDATSAIEQWTDVLLHEARESLQEPLSEPPEDPYLHPVDVDTEEPGIVHSRGDVHILRRSRGDVPRCEYRTRQGSVGASANRSVCTAHRQEEVGRPDAEAVRQAKHKEAAAVLKKAQNAAASSERQRLKRERRKQEETPDEKARRTEEAREKRRAKKAEADALPRAASVAPSKPAEGVAVCEGGNVEDEDLEGDASVAWARPDAPVGRRLRKRDARKIHFFAHPLPHHRHLTALMASQPNEALVPSLLRGDPCDSLRVIQGPPGTGKTWTLVSTLVDLPTDQRVLLVAPTNVGAANLYSVCLRQGWADECSLVLAPNRVPVGTVVLSDDPRRRIVCSTVSGRGGPRLDGEGFENVLHDEAAQCMEAITWTLLRPEVHFLALAGDVRQLPACVSQSGKALHHERSLMERLVVNLSYANVSHLTVQRRMSPEILALPNEAFYGGALVCGDGAPQEGSVAWIHRDDGAEQAKGTSFVNRVEAEVVATFAKRLIDAEGVAAESIVLLTPYAAQVKILLAHRTGCEVHTIDSFQGRESRTVILCTVRDGTGGLGFWDDERRLVVALTRARERLVVVSSGTWPHDSVLSRWRAKHAALTT